MKYLTLALMLAFTTPALARNGRTRTRASRSPHENRRKLDAPPALGAGRGQRGAALGHVLTKFGFLVFN